MKNKVKVTRRVLKELEILAEMKVFEEKYGMSSDEFFTKFHRGELKDEGATIGDFIEWSGFCRMLASARDSRESSVKA